MEEILLFIDGSANAQSKVGYGAFLAVPEPGISLDLLRERVKVRRFEHTSSTKLELQTLLWALSDINTWGREVVVHTDSQNITVLQGRRKRFEQNNYYSKKNRRLSNFELYQEFFRVTDLIHCKFVKVHGHEPSNKKNDIGNIFSLVDKASRNALRGDNRNTL